jgi:hypothetical protein
MILEAIILGAIAGTLAGRPLGNLVTERMLARDEAWIAREIAKGEQFNDDLQHNPEAAIAYLEREFGHMREHRADIDDLIASIRRRAAMHP